MKKYLLLYFISFHVLANIQIGQFSLMSVKDHTNKTFSFSERKKPLIAIFISKDCPCSKGNLSYINNLSKEFPEFDFVAIHSKKGSTLDEVKNYLADKNLNFDVILDSDMKVATMFEALKTPHAYIVNASGNVLYNGGITSTTFPENAKEFYLKNALNELKEHKPISKPETKTLGCFIVR